METDFDYQFTSIQSIESISDYFKTNLPSYGWDVLQTSILHGDENNPTEICLDLAEINGHLQAIMWISRMPGEELSFVTITIFTTD